MKTIGNAILNKKEINGKEKFYIKVREYRRDGSFDEAELFCRMTNKMRDFIGDILENATDLPIEIKESFYTVDYYYKGEQKYAKPTLVLEEFEFEF